MHCSAGEKASVMVIAPCFGPTMECGCAATFGSICLDCERASAAAVRKRAAAPRVFAISRCNHCPSDSACLLMLRRGGTPRALPRHDASGITASGKATAAPTRGLGATFQQSERTGTRREETNDWRLESALPLCLARCCYETGCSGAHSNRARAGRSTEA